jgi:adenylylsulfate kinase-like enzyme
MESLPGAIDAIVVTGPVGAGKTTTAASLAALLRQHEICHAFVDVDEIRRFYPDAPGDRFNHRIAMKNIAALSRNFIEAGARCLVFADVIEEERHRNAYVDAIPHARVIVVRLNVHLEHLVARLRQRESPETIAWYLDRAPELQDLMERNNVGDLVIEIDGHTPQQVAEEIFRKLALG